MSIIVNHSHHYWTHRHTHAATVSITIHYHQFLGFQLRDHFPSLTQSENYFPLFEKLTATDLLSKRKWSKELFWRLKNAPNCSSANIVKGNYSCSKKKNDKRLKLIGAFKSINGSENFLENITKKKFHCSSAHCCLDRASVVTLKIRFGHF